MSENISTSDFYFRYCECIIKKTGMSNIEAVSYAGTAFDSWDRVDTPEECVEDEMSYWGD